MCETIADMPDLNGNFMELYLDDSGSRLPDLRSEETPAGEMNCFALGGILFEKQNTADLIESYIGFREKWNITYPLHSNSIRLRKENFTWLAGLSPPMAAEFFSDIERMLHSQPFFAIACVIHRPGYNDRYTKIYGDKRWMLCKTAYSIVVERASKYAMRNQLQLRVHFEESGKREDRDLLGYHRELKKNGMPFRMDNSSKYRPLNPEDFRKTMLGDPERHRKMSPFCQLADLVLYPIARAKYTPEYRPYRFLKHANKLIDGAVLPEEVATVGIKYSCFD